MHPRPGERTRTRARASCKAKGAERSHSTPGRPGATRARVCAAGGARGARNPPQQARGEADTFSGRRSAARSAPAAHLGWGGLEACSRRRQSRRCCRNTAAERGGHARVPPARGEWLAPHAEALQCCRSSRLTRGTCRPRCLVSAPRIRRRGGAERRGAGSGPVGVPG